MNILIQQVSTQMDTIAAAEHLKQGGGVILSTEGLAWEKAQSAIDFCSGVATAIDGDFRELGESLFFFGSADVRFSELEPIGSLMRNFRSPLGPGFLRLVGPMDG